MGRTQSRAEREIADALKARRLQPCMRCGQPIDYDADRDDPAAFNAGHIKSWQDYPELRADPANYRQEHQRCNKSAKKREALELGINSRQW